MARAKLLIYNGGCHLCYLCYLSPNRVKSESGMRAAALASVVGSEGRYGEHGKQVAQVAQVEQEPIKWDSFLCHLSTDSGELCTAGVGIPTSGRLFFGRPVQGGVRFAGKRAADRSAPSAGARRTSNR